MGIFSAIGMVLPKWEKTVGPEQDYASIALAKADMQGKILRTPKLTLTKGNYNEIILDGTEEFLFNTLEIIGDERDIADTNYVNGYAISSDASDGGEGTCSVSNSGNDLVITGTITNPNFETAGIVAGDKILSMDNTYTVVEYTVASVSTNTITLTTTAPTICNTGTCVAILPNVEITNSEKFVNMLAKSSPVQLKLKGIYFKRSSGSIYAIYMEKGYMGSIQLESCCFNGNFQATDLIRTTFAKVETIGKNNSLWNVNHYGIYAYTSELYINYLNFIKTDGIYSLSCNIIGSYMKLMGDGTVENAIRAYSSQVYVTVTSIYKCSYGIFNQSLSKTRADYNSVKFARAAAFYANKISYIEAAAVTVSDNIVDFSPGTSMVAGNHGSYIYNS